MKQALLIVLLVSVRSLMAFCVPPDYDGGNGTIVETHKTEAGRLIVREHDQTVEIGNLAEPENLSVYEQRSQGSGVVAHLAMGDEIHISRTAELLRDESHTVWLSVSTEDESSGWILLGQYSYEHAEFRNPYFENRWSILERLNVGSNTWTIRKMPYQHVAVWVKLNVRSNPGLDNTDVIAQIVPGQNGQAQV